jgi:hypothetical protein
VFQMYYIKKKWYKGKILFFFAFYIVLYTINQIWYKDAYSILYMITKHNSALVLYFFLSFLFFSFLLLVFILEQIPNTTYKMVLHVLKKCELQCSISFLSYFAKYSIIYNFLRSIYFDSLNASTFLCFHLYFFL